MAAIQALLPLAGCYDHHARIEERGPECRAPRIVGPETGRAGAPCDDCAGRHAAPLVVRGAIAYRHALDLEVIDVSVPREPVLVAHIPTVSPRASSLAVADDTLLIGGAFAEVFDLATPLLPRASATLFGAAVGFTVAARGALGLVLSPEPGGTVLRTFDLADPGSPIALGSVVVGETGAVEHVAMTRTIAWVVRANRDDALAAWQHELVAVDLRDPRVPRIASSTPISAPTPVIGFVSTLTIVDDRLLVCGSLGDSAGRYFDVTTDSPILRAAYVPPSCGVLVTRDRSVAATFLGRGVSRIALYDVTSPEAPLELGHAEHRGHAEHAAIVGDALLVSNEHGLVAYPLACD